MIHQLHTALQRVCENWESFRAVASFSLLARRILSLTSSPDARFGALGFLVRLRQVSMKWLSRLKQRISASTDDQQRAELYSRATEIALLCAGTYDVDDTYIDFVLQQNTAISTLLQCSITIEENHATVQYEHQSLYDSSLYAWKNMMHRLFPALRALILRDNAELNEAVTENWAAFQSSQQWTSYEAPREHWLHTSSGELPVHLNLLTAELLVNGLPLARLPENYMRHAMYAILFYKSTISVVPTDEPGLDFDAKAPYHECKLHFGMSGVDMLLVAQKAASRWDLLPSRVFQNRLPQMFISDFTHWYNHTNDTVEFRRRTAPWSTTADTWQLQHDTLTRTWCLVQMSRSLMNMTSTSARGLSTVFRSLEDAEHVHIVLDDSTGIVDIELPRLQLGFYVDQENLQIQSRQYRGMVIDRDQNIGCLVGLVSKLVLRSASDRMIIIPAARRFDDGSIRYSASKTHWHTDVVIRKSQATKVYAYCIDETLGRIIDSGDIEAKLLLSYLHALTSHSMVDPLTKVTGVESSLIILRSAAMRSFDVLTQRHVELLNQIGRLSTRREFYPRHACVMQQVYWDESLPSLSQHEAFRTSVGNILDQALKSSYFFPDDPIYSSIKDAVDDIASDYRLDYRHVIRDAVFRVSGFGAEEFIVKNLAYDARDRNEPNSRSNRVYRTATMVLADQPALHSAVPGLKYALQENHFQNKIIAGIDNNFDPSCLCYDSKWLGELSPHLVQLWCSLHRYLPDVVLGGCNEYDIMMWLATLSYASSADMNAIQTLFGFYRLQELRDLQPPSAARFYLAEGDFWKGNEIVDIAYRAAKSYKSSPEASLPKCGSETKKEHENRIYTLFLNRRNAAIQNFNAALQQQWPVRAPAVPTSAQINTYMDVGIAMEGVRSKLEVWYENRQFDIYLQQLSTFVARESHVDIVSPHYLLGTTQALSKLQAGRRHFGIEDVFNTTSPMIAIGRTDEITTASVVVPPGLDVEMIEPESLARSSGTFNSLLDLCRMLQTFAKSNCEVSYVEALRKSCAALEKRTDHSAVQTKFVSNFRDVLQQHLRDCEAYLDLVSSALQQSVDSINLVSSRIAARNCLTARICPQFWLGQLHNDRFRNLSEHWKDAIVNYGLAITDLHRAQRLVALADKPVDLIEELNHVGHRNWRPQDFPETLLLEVENSILVREEQEFFASQMRVDAGVNTVLQLLMGGGKSTTIVPMLSASLSGDRKKLVRVIVAKSNSKQMAHMLVAKLGGLLNRRVYYMPFSRNLSITLENANSIRDLYTECVANQGVLMVLPEQILSFRLMAVECALTNQDAIAQSLLSTQVFFDQTSCDIIDESDANLDVKFELIYTMGIQESIDFAPQRWVITQEVLSLVPGYASQVKMKLPEAVDIQVAGDGKFPRVRLLRVDAADQLLEHIAKHIVRYGVSGLPSSSQTETMQAAILKYITQSELDDSDIRAVETSRFWTESTRSPLLLIRGLIAGGVLRFALRAKRYRVNYGLDPSRTPATKLAVPYRAKDLPSPRSEFSHPECVSTASPDLPAAFRQLFGISIRDRQQCIVEVFPAFRHSRKAIDYFLSHLVFPKQLKQFPYKLSNSGWDVGMKKTHSTTGFSGTNDALHLLPLDMKHLDLPSQLHTNAQVLAYLLQEETSIKLLPQRSDNSTKDGDHLLRVIEGLPFDIRVLIDCGASILEQNNRQVAEAWLAMRKHDIQAVVYFEDDELTVLDRTGRIESFQTSSFARNLAVCTIYLDEAHARGTDLKLPRTYRAALTLGSQLTKDRLTQGAMRMRKLGNGQSVTFIVPEEVENKIRELTGRSPHQMIEVKDVLCWSIEQTWQELKRSMPIWAIQGHRYEQQRGLLNGAETTKAQAQAFLEAEAQDLEKRYRPHVKDNKSPSQLLQWDQSNATIAQIVSRCREFDATSFSSATLSEEQERELAPEIEEERQVERPRRMFPEKHVVHQDLLRLARSGEFVTNSDAWESAFEALRSTSAGQLSGIPQFPSDLLVTKDFMRTIKPYPGSTRAPFISDAWQRQVQFIISVPNPTSQGTVKNLIIISPYEANYLLPCIRESQEVTLHLFAPRSNASFESLDHLMLYYVGHLFAPCCVPRSIILQLNLFAGSLYLDCYSDYKELCDYLGLLRTQAEQYQQIEPDGFVNPSSGLWKLQTSPVPFLKALLMKIRREGEGVEKTHTGKILNGIRLKESDFEHQ